MDSETCPACLSRNFKKVGRKTAGLDVVECSRCTLVFSSPLLKGSADDVGSSLSSVTDGHYYDDIKSNHEKRKAIAVAKVHRLRSDYLAKWGIAPKKVLEFGCGTGDYAQAWLAAGASWTGVETSPQMLEFCRSRNLPVIDSTDASQLVEGSFDLIYFSQVLEHVLEPRPFLQQVRRLLASGGLVHLDVPNHDSLISRLRRVNPSASGFGFIQPPHHLVAYRKKSLRLLLAACGLEPLDIAAYPNNHPVYGQLLVEPSLPHRVAMGVDRVLGTGSLLVAMAMARAG